jgi:hypothetical protein
MDRDQCETRASQRSYLVYKVSPVIVEERSLMVLRNSRAYMDPSLNPMCTTEAEVWVSRSTMGTLQMAYLGLLISLKWEVKCCKIYWNLDFATYHEFAIFWTLKRCSEIRCPRVLKYFLKDLEFKTKLHRANEWLHETGEFKKLNDKRSVWASILTKISKRVYGWRGFTELMK